MLTTSKNTQPWINCMKVPKKKAAGGSFNLKPSCIYKKAAFFLCYIFGFLRMEIWGFNNIILGTSKGSGNAEDIYVSATNLSATDAIMRVLQQQRNETNLWINKANNYTQVRPSNQPWVQRLFVFQALVWCWKAECLLLRFKDLEDDLFILGNWRLFFVNVSFRVIPFATADSFLLRPLASQWVWGAEAALAWRVENKAPSPPHTHTHTRQMSTERTNIAAGHLKARRQKKKKKKS